MNKVVTFGELMLRLSPTGANRFSQADSFDAYYGGAEANVAVLLARLGMESTYITKLPENDISEKGISVLRGNGVDVSGILRGGNRMGIYFLEKGASQRSSKVIYDRAYSSFSLSHSSEYDWDCILKDAAWLHLSGITPALSEELESACMDAVNEAKRRNIFVSFDLNYRSLLWDVHRASYVLKEFVKKADLCIANEEHIQSLLEINPTAPRGEDSELTADGYRELVSGLLEKYGCKMAAVTMRRSISAEKNKFSAMISDGNSLLFAPMYDIDITDRVGAGDSFSAGLIYALSSEYDLQRAINFAAASGCLKHSVNGDFAMLDKNEIESLIDGEKTAELKGNFTL